MIAAELEQLLALLDMDRDQAARRYEEIRKQLIRRFEGLGCTAPEELADLTFDRFARRLAKGLELKNENPGGFIYGIAANVFKEWRRKTISQEVLHDINTGPTSEDPVDLAGDEERLRHRRCLRHCLDRLSKDQRQMVLAYYTGEDRIGARHTLAGQLCLTLNALRIRAHRARRQLEECVHRCLELRAVSSRRQP